MILDSRIKEGKRPLTCIDIEQAREFVGKECIFSDFFLNYVDIEKFNIDNDNEHTGILSIDDNSSDYIFINDRNESRYRFILPCEWLPKATEFVPYTLDTWEHEFNPGDVITFRGKVGTERAGRQYKCIYAGWRRVINSDITQDATVTVDLGLWGFTFKELSELYEIYRDNTWEPFGRKVETIDLNVI